VADVSVGALTACFIGGPASDSAGAVACWSPNDGDDASPQPILTLATPAPDAAQGAAAGDGVAGETGQADQEMPSTGPFGGEQGDEGAEEVPAADGEGETP
jgi:hypothetical protein